MARGKAVGVVQALRVLFRCYGGPVYTTILPKTLQFTQRVLYTLSHAVFGENVEKDGLRLVLVSFELQEELFGLGVRVRATKS